MEIKSTNIFKAIAEAEAARRNSPQSSVSELSSEDKEIILKEAGGVMAPQELGAQPFYVPGVQLPAKKRIKGT